MNNIIKCVALLLLLCMCVTGCGSEGDSSTDSNPSTSLDSSETATSQEVSSVNSTTESKTEVSSNEGVTSSNIVSSNTSSAETMTKEKYIENLKKSDIFKKYDKNDWRSHAYDYKLIAFTFDDGPVFSEPGDNAVTAVADVFEGVEGRGTFFFTGRSLTANGSGVPKYVLSKGHELANHSYSHGNLGAESDTYKSLEEVESVNTWYKDNMQYDCKFFRGGGYSANSDVYSYLSQINMPAIGSYQGFADYSAGASTLEGIVDWFDENSVPDGAVIGMHSTRDDKVTAKALAEVLPKLYAKGYRFCTLSELFAFKGVEIDDIPKNHYVSKCEITNNGTIAFR